MKCPICGQEVTNRRERPKPCSFNFHSEKTKKAAEDLKEFLGHEIRTAVDCEVYLQSKGHDVIGLNLSRVRNAAGVVTTQRARKSWWMVKPVEVTSK